MLHGFVCLTDVYIVVVCMTQFEMHWHCLVRHLAWSLIKSVLISEATSTPGLFVSSSVESEREYSVHPFYLTATEIK